MSELTALILEDAFLIAYEAEQALLELGANSVVIFQDLMEAVEALNRQDKFDFAVLDLSLSDGNSIEFAKTIRSMGIPFIFTSGWASPVYTDCRRLISFPRVRKTLIDFGASTVFR